MIRSPRSALLSFLFLLAIAVLLTGCDDPFTADTDPVGAGTTLDYIQPTRNWDTRGGSPHPSGGFLLTGGFSSNPADGGFVVHVGTDGRNLGDAELQYAANHASANANGEWFVTGHTGELGLFVGKLTSSGALRWMQFVEGSEGTAVYPTQDGGCLVAGRADGSPLLARLNNLGQVIWRQTFNTVPGRAHDLAFLGDGYLLAVTDLTSQPNGAPALIRTDLDGNLVWNLTYGDGRAGAFRTLQPLAQGYIAAGGQVGGNVLDPETYVVIVDGNGAVIWDWTYLAPTAEDQFYLHDLSVRGDGRVVAAGTVGSSRYRALAAVLDEDGTPGWIRAMEDIDRFSDGLAVTAIDGRILLAGRGYANDLDGNMDVFLLSTNNDPLGE